MSHGGIPKAGQCPRGVASRRRSNRPPPWPPRCPRLVPHPGPHQVLTLLPLSLPPPPCPALSQAFPVTPEVEKAMEGSGEPTCRCGPCRAEAASRQNTPVDRPQSTCACPIPATTTERSRRPLPAGEPFELHGLVLRSTLLQLLRSRRGFINPQDSSPLPVRRQQQQQPGQQQRTVAGGGGGSGSGGSSGGRQGQFPGGPALAPGSADYAAAVAAQQPE